MAKKYTVEQRLARIEAILATKERQRTKQQKRAEEREKLEAIWNEKAKKAIAAKIKEMTPPSWVVLDSDLNAYSSRGESPEISAMREAKKEYGQVYEIRVAPGYEAGPEIWRRRRGESTEVELKPSVHTWIVFGKRWPSPVGAHLCESCNGAGWVSGDENSDD
jgi:hypothetical protein